MERLILFDIDGTLTRTENGYVPFNEAILQTFGCNGDIRTVVPDGNTDPLIIQDIFAKANFVFEFQDRIWQQFTVNLRERYHHHVLQGTTKIRALAGADALLRALAANEKICPSVVTGNFEATAEIKLETAGLAPYLCRGAYASDSPVRADLPAIAKARREQLTGSTLLAEHCIVVGDTPNDLQAARQNDMKCILVGTGRYPIEDMRYWEPDACVPDLSDTDEVLRLLSTI
jgi:phosphoglycolate phosphatase-like HAD superfamily hydrolase